MTALGIDLRKIPGVGEAIADIITRLRRTGSHPGLDAMREEIPAGVLEMLSVPGLRPEKVMKLYKEPGITSLAALEEAARADRLKGVKGLGPALQAKILQGIAISREAEGRLHLHRAARLLDSAEERLRQAHPDLKRITPAGDFRRGCELVADLSMVVEAPNAAAETIRSGSQLQVHLTDPARYGITLLHATGSGAHLEQLAALAARKGFVLDETGLHRARKVIARTEEEIYAALGLAFIEPELREGKDEIALAVEQDLPKLVTDKDLRGILHAHTDRSDGVDTLEVMAEATRARGYQYFGVADHSKSAHYAGGLSVDEIDAQHAEIDRLNKRYGRAFASSRASNPTSSPMARSTIRTRCWPASILSSPACTADSSSTARRRRSASSARVQNPYTTILGHMTGRQLLRRPGYDIDIEKILAACAAARRRGRNQRQSVAARPGLALAPPRAGTRLHDEHQSRCAFDPRNRSDALGRGNGAQRRRARRPRAQCPHTSPPDAASQAQQDRPGPRGLRIDRSNLCHAPTGRAICVSRS